MHIISAFHDQWKRDTREPIRSLTCALDPIDKDQDYFAWLLKNAGHLNRSEFDQIDRITLIDELTRHANDQAFRIRSQYSDMVQYLILLSTAPAAGSDARTVWKQQLSMRRILFQSILRKNPSIRQFLPAIFQYGWSTGRMNAIRELSSGSYLDGAIRQEVLTAERVAGPWEERLTYYCPWTPEQIISFDPSNPHDALTNSYELPFEDQPR